MTKKQRARLELVVGVKVTGAGERELVALRISGYFCDKFDSCVKSCREYVCQWLKEHRRLVLFWYGLSSEALPGLSQGERAVNVLKFRIRYQDGRTEELAVEGDRVLIGSGAHCEIRLPVDQAAIEHVSVQTGPTGLTADALTFQPPPTLNGMPFSKTQLLPDAILGIGQCQIRAVMGEQGVGGAVIHSKKQKTSPATLLLAAVAVPISLYVLMADDGQTGTGPAPKDIPELWGEVVKTCPQNGPQALVMAQEKRGAGDTKRERRPFFVQDGVAAVPLYETAAACFATGGDANASKESSDAAVTLRRQVAEDYRTHRVRLEHALSVNDWGTAHREASVLLAFTEGKQCDYVTWLANLERQLQLKYGKKRR